MKQKKSRKSNESNQPANIYAQLIVDLTAKCGITKTQVLTNTGIDLTKYNHSKSIPTIQTCTLVFDYLKIPTEIVSMFAAMEIDQKVSHEDVLNALKDWRKFEHVFHGFCLSILELVKIFQNPK